MASPARKSEAAPTTATATIAVDNRARHIKAIWYEKAKDGSVRIGGGSSGAMFKLLPGLNHAVPVALWECVLKNPVWARWSEKGEVAEVKKPPNKWTHEAALDLIERSADIASMSRWRKVERRGEVRKRLDKKLDEMRKLAVAPKDRDVEDEDEDDEGIDV